MKKFKWSTFYQSKGSFPSVCRCHMSWQGVNYRSNVCISYHKERENKLDMKTSTRVCLLHAKCYTYVGSPCRDVSVIEVIPALCKVDDNQAWPLGWTLQGNLIMHWPIIVALFQVKLITISFKDTSHDSDI